MMLTNLSKNLLIILVFLQVSCFAAVTKQGIKVAKANLDNSIVNKLKNATPAQLNKYKTDAAKRLQADLGKAFQALSTNTKDVPPKVRNSAKAALQLVRSGKLTVPLTKTMPMILQKASANPGKPAEQLQSVLATLIPSASGDSKNPLQGVLDFVSTNLNGVNTLLGRVLGGTNDLLSGVVKSLAGNLGAVTEALTSTLGSLGSLLGGLGGLGGIGR